MTTKEKIQRVMERLAISPEKINKVIRKRRSSNKIYTDEYIGKVLQQYYDSGMSVNKFSKQIMIPRATLHQWLYIVEDNVKESKGDVDQVTSQVETDDTSDEATTEEHEISTWAENAGKYIDNLLKEHQKEINKFLTQEDSTTGVQVYQDVDNEDVTKGIFKLLFDQSGKLLTKLERYRQARELAIINKMIFKPEIYKAFIETKFYHLYCSRFNCPSVRPYISCFINMIRAVDEKIDLSTRPLADKLILNILIDLNLVIEEEDRLYLSEYGKDILHIPLNSSYEFLLMANNKHLRFL